MSKNYNKFTGEVMPFRVQYHKSDFCDNEHIEGESMTDASDYEDINDTIEKCARTGALREYEKLMSQADNLPVSFDDFDETERSDFDISEAKDMLNKFEEKLKTESVVPNSSASQGQTSVASANEAETNSGETNG